MHISTLNTIMSILFGSTNWVLIYKKKNYQKYGEHDAFSGLNATTKKKNAHRKGETNRTTMQKSKRLWKFYRFNMQHAHTFVCTYTCHTMYIYAMYTYARIHTEYNIYIYQFIHRKAAKDRVVPLCKSMLVLTFEQLYYIIIFSTSLSHSRFDSYFTPHSSLSSYSRTKMYSSFRSPALTRARTYLSIYLSIYV